MRTPSGDIRWFVDTNVLVYSRDAREPAKQGRASAWLKTVLASGRLVLSPQIINETCSVLLKREKDRARHAEIRAFARGFLIWCNAPLDKEVVGQALFIHEQHGVSWWDCPMVASALAADADYLLSEDLQDGRRFGRLQIVDPFRIAPEDFLASLASRPT